MTTPSQPQSNTRLDWPLMKNNVTRADLDVLIEYLQQDEPMLTQSANVRAFEEEWSAAFPRSTVASPPTSSG